MNKKTSDLSTVARAILAASLMATATGAGAQQQAPTAKAVARVASPRHAAAQAAGTRALHLCTGYFASGDPRALIDAIAPTNGHPIAPADARTEVDEAARTVSVYFDDDMAPRMAVARPVIGCTLLPIGAGKALADTLPRPDIDAAPGLDDRTWPMGDRNAVAKLPAQRQAAVERVIDEAFRDERGRYSGISWGIVVVKDGRIVAERYQHGFGPHYAARTNSMCKSVASTLAGVGIQKGLLRLDSKNLLAAWRRPGDPRADITLNDLLHMASGLYTESAGDRQNEIYLSGAPVIEAAAMNVVDARPGARHVYAGGDPLLSTRAVREAFNDDAAFLTFPYRELFWKIGMTRTIVETDINDDFLSSGQCWSTARDFGRFGMLYLADGMWNGERILPEGWSRYVSTLAPVQPGPEREARYGGLFWLYGGIDGLPADAYSPAGARGQFAMIIPSKNMVIVRRGFDQSSGFEIARFAGDIIRAMEN